VASGTPLDFADDVFRLCEAIVDHQPTGAFRHRAAQGQDHAPEQGAHAEGCAPAEVRRQQSRIEQQRRRQRAEGGAEPEAAVDDEVGASAIACRRQLLDRGADGGILAADTGAGEEAEQREPGQGRRQPAHRGGDEVQAQRHQEQRLAAVTVCQPAEHHGTQHRAGKIGARRQPHLGIAQMQLRAGFQRTGDRAGQRHLQSVQHPGDAEREHDAAVESAPGQCVQACGDICLNGCLNGRLDDAAKRRSSLHVASLRALS
jgi:hypothetical protein